MSQGPVSDPRVSTSDASPLEQATGPSLDPAGSFFSGLTPRKFDRIFDANERFKADPNPNKISLVVGTLVDENGLVPQFKAWKDAEAVFLANREKKASGDFGHGYMPSEGHKVFSNLALRLLLDPASLRDGRRDPLPGGHHVSVQALSGTSALMMAQELLMLVHKEKNFLSGTAIIPAPTWGVHVQGFKKRGFNVVSPAFCDKMGRQIDHSARRSAMIKATPGTVICYDDGPQNPTGLMMGRDDWKEDADICKRYGLIPVLDSAYAMLGRGAEIDSAGSRIFAESGIHALIAQSFSKNMSAYRKKIGAVHVLNLANTEDVRTVSSILSVDIVRPDFSNPPGDPAVIASILLNTPEFFRGLEQECKDAISHMLHMTVALAEICKGANISEGDRTALTSAAGLFFCHPKFAEHCEFLWRVFGVHLVDVGNGLGRINRAAITEKNLARVGEAVVYALTH